MSLANPILIGLIAGGMIVAGGLLGKAYLDGQDSMKPRLEAADDNAAGRGLEALGQTKIAAKTETTLQRAAQLQEKTHDFARRVAADPASAAPLSPARADRLRDHDRFLCVQAPTSCPATQALDPGNG